MSKRFSKEPEKFGTGHVEGIVESGAANNSALAGAWIPALVFGIPGDSITAIVDRRALPEGHEPGADDLHQQPAERSTRSSCVFILANLLMLPLGWLAIKVRASACCACRASC